MSHTYHMLGETKQDPCFGSSLFLKVVLASFLSFSTGKYLQIYYAGPFSSPPCILLAHLLCQPLWLYPPGCHLTAPCLSCISLTFRFGASLTLCVCSVNLEVQGVHPPWDILPQWGEGGCGWLAAPLSCLQVDGPQVQSQLPKCSPRSVRSPRCPEW